MRIFPKIKQITPVKTLSAPRFIGLFRLLTKNSNIFLASLNTNYNTMVFLTKTYLTVETKHSIANERNE